MSVLLKPAGEQWCVKLMLVKVQCVTVKLFTILSNNSDVIEYKKHEMIQK